MSVQVGTTTVIDNSRKLTSITGADGSYDAFHPNPATITNVINFNTPMMYAFLSSATTFSLSGTGAGKAAMLLLDTSSDTHAPTFPSDVKWTSGSVPNWGDFRHWQISLQCDVGNPGIVRASALGYTATTAPVPPESVSLIGSAGAPYDIFFDTGAGSIVLGWGFYTNGEVWRILPGGAVKDGDWCSNNPPNGNYWARVSINTGATAQDRPDPTFSDDLNVWLPFDGSVGNILVKWSVEFQQFASGSVKVELSDQSDGSNILATGYYGIEVESGE